MLFEQAFLLAAKKKASLFFYKHRPQSKAIIFIITTVYEALLYSLEKFFYYVNYNSQTKSYDIQMRLLLKHIIYLEDWFAIIPYQIDA